MHAWDTMIEGRDMLSWQHGRHSLKFGGELPAVHLADVGILPEPRLLSVHQRLHHPDGPTTAAGSALASFLLGLPAVRQRQAGIPQMNLRQWYADGFVQDSWRVTPTTTLDMGLRYEFMSPLVRHQLHQYQSVFNNGVPSVFIGGQNGYPAGLMYPNKHNFAPRLGFAQNFPTLGLVLHAAYGIFYTPVDMNTWCNQRHNVPYVFPETKQSDNFTSAAALFTNGFNFNTPVLGETTVSFTAFDPHAPAQYIQQWSASVEKSLGKTHYARGRLSGRPRIPSAARAPHQQRASRARA